MERPILFSTPMVQAIIGGGKTQTRRVVKSKWTIKSVSPNGKVATGENGLTWELNCPYGKVGDLLWVRETSMYVQNEHAHDLLEGSKDRNQWVYKASMHEDFIQYAKEKYGYNWKPSIYMPKEAARIWLEITNIRVERLQDISGQDSVAEGVFQTFKGDRIDHNWIAFKNYIDDGRGSLTADKSFQTLWVSINGEESWKENPWVWVVEFKRIK